MTVTAVSSSGLETAIQRAQDVLWNSQRSDGSWEAKCSIGPSATAQVVMALSYLGEISTDELHAAARWMETQQRTDGSFVAYPLALSGDVATTTGCWAMLSISGGSGEAIARAWAYIEANGGLSAAVRAIGGGDLSALFAAMVGKVSPQEIPAPPMVTGWFAPARWWLNRRFSQNVMMLMLEMAMIVPRLQGAWPESGPVMPLARCAGHFLKEYLHRYQNPNGGWNEFTVQSAITLVALRACGVRSSDADYQRGVRWLRSQAQRQGDQLWFDAFGSSVWTTAFNLRALYESGISPGDPRVVRTLDWLVEAQCTVKQPSELNRRWWRPHTGGWGFEHHNQTMPDCDDTGVVLSVFGRAMQPRTSGEPLDPARKRRLREAIAKGQDWLSGMQNPDGGWASFTYGLPSKPAGPIMTEPMVIPFDEPLKLIEMLLCPPLAAGDPATEDVTARVIHGLALTGQKQHRSVRRGLRFLRSKADSDGAFWGRWICNFLTGTSFSLLAASAAGEDMTADWIVRAIGWLWMRQNPDGSWGETAASYADPDLAGKGAGIASLTALVSSAAISVGRGDRPQVTNAIRWLMAQQKTDGTWDNGDWLTPVIPPNTFYLYPGAPRYYPLEALGRYRAHLHGGSDPNG